jgi:hypothetical protein
MCSRIAKSVLTVAAVVGLSGGAGSSPAAEEGFRVESKVFVGNDKEPKAESTTVFCQGVIYDYLRNPPETIVLDPARGRFVLLDPNRRVRTELTTQEVVALNENLRHWTATQTDAFLKFLGAPKFEEQSDERTAEVTFQSPWMTYRVATIDAESDAIAQQYRDFTDWYARLNTRLNPGYKFVFARLALNESLQKRRQLPREITLTVQPKRALTFQKTIIRSEHQFVFRLVESDRDRMAQTGQFMAIFQPVDFTEYEKKAEP